MIEGATLAVQIHSTNPPRPCGVVVMVARTPIATITLAELRRVATLVDAMEVAVEKALAPRCLDYDEDMP